MAGSPVLQLTSQIETPYLDQQLAYIHEAPDQLAMLKAVSKGAWRVHSAETALATVREAVRVALTAPTGPVSVEVPIDIQKAFIDADSVPTPAPIQIAEFAPSDVEALAAALASAKRPLLWLGGGARDAASAARRLVDMGFGVISSVQGRGIVTEDDPASLGSFTADPDVEAFYATCDAVLVVGSRLRSNETLTYRLRLPTPLYRVDADGLAAGRCYASKLFVRGDASEVLNALADRLEGKLIVDAAFKSDLAAAREGARTRMRSALGPYSRLVDALQSAVGVGRHFNWVRDITLSNSIWGNRAPALADPRSGVHAVGGGIGQGLGMGIGAAIGATVGDGRKTVCLAGDGGFIMNVGELATAVQEQVDLLILLMNNGGYGVIKNIQDAHYGSRHCYVDLHTPDYAALAQSLGVVYQKVDNLDTADAVLAKALASKGPRIVEFDMHAIGDFAKAFAGPPVRGK